MMSRWAELKAAIPPPVEQREIRTPEELPGYDDYRRFGRDPWRQLEPGVWTDGQHVLIWAIGDPDHGLLLSGARAQAILSASRGRG